MLTKWQKLSVGVFIITILLYGSLLFHLLTYCFILLTGGGFSDPAFQQRDNGNMRYEVCQEWCLPCQPFSPWLATSFKCHLGSYSKGQMWLPQVYQCPVRRPYEQCLGLLDSRSHLHTEIFLVHWNFLMLWFKRITSNIQIPLLTLLKTKTNKERNLPPRGNRVCRDNNPVGLLIAGRHH